MKQITIVYDNGKKVVKQTKDAWFGKSENGLSITYQPCRSKEIKQIPITEDMGQIYFDDKYID